MSSSPYHLGPEELLADVRWLQRFARSLVQDEARAEELAQDAWLKAVERGAERPVGTLRAWLAQVVRNLVAHNWRDADLRRSYEGRAAGERPATVETHQDLERLELQRRIVVAVLALEEPYRTTIVLHHLRELPYDEIARRLGVAEPTVRKRNSRGLALLRARLKGELGGDEGFQRGLRALAASVRARPISGTRIPPWLTAATLAVVALAALLRSGSRAVAPYEPGGGIPTLAAGAFAALDPWLGRWNAVGCPLSPELRHGQAGLSMLWVERRFEEGEPVQRSEALIGWDPGERRLVYLQFSEEMPAYETTAEGSLWVDEHGQLRRTYDVFEPDGSRRTYRELFSDLGDGTKRRAFELLEPSGDWSLIMDPVLVPARAADGPLGAERPDPPVEPGHEARRTRRDQEALAALEFLVGRWSFVEEPGAGVTLGFGPSRRFLECSSWRSDAPEGAEVLAHGRIGWHHGRAELVLVRFAPGRMDRGSGRLEPGPALVIDHAASSEAGREFRRETLRLTAEGRLELVTEERDAEGAWRSRARRTAERVER